MTSQTKTDKRIALEREAKELDIKGRLPTQDAALEAKIKTANLIKSKLVVGASNVEESEIEEVVAQVGKEPVHESVQVETPKRKKAPRMTVAGINTDSRTEAVERLEREDPDCKYIFQNSSISDKDLAAKGLERTGESVKNDILCRTMKDSYEEVLAAKNEGQFESMQRIDGGTGIVGNHEARPKSPKS
jgi:predicted ATPase with chaperone activity